MTRATEKQRGLGGKRKGELEKLLFEEMRQGRETGNIMGGAR